MCHVLTQSVSETSSSGRGLVIIDETICAKKNECLHYEYTTLDTLITHY